MPRRFLRVENYKMANKYSQIKFIRAKIITNVIFGLNLSLDKFIGEDLCNFPNKDVKLV